MGRTIVVVDDDAFITTMYQETLTKAGFTVVLASNAEEALQAVVHEKPDIMLLDLVMPGYDGFEILKAMKANEATKQVPVVILSNLTQDDVEEQARSLGAIDYIVKVNLPPRELITRLNRVLSDVGRDSSPPVTS
jgi:PleD family two-component response regulator